MSAPIPLQVPQGSYLGSVSFYRMPGGAIRSELTDMPPAVIEAEPTVTERFNKLAEWCFKGAFDLLRQGEQFKDETP